MPLRLLAFVDSPGFGGAEQCLGYLLRELDPAFRVAIAGVSAVPVKQIAAQRPGTAWTVLADSGVRACASAIRTWRPDVVHVNRAHLYAGRGATLAGILSPGVATVCVEHLPWAGDVSRREKWAQRWVGRGIQAHVAVGARAARLVESVVGYPRGSVLAVPNGVPIHDQGSVPRPADGLVIGSLGRITAQKRYEDLIGVLPGLPDTTLVLVGDGPERASLEAQAAALGVADRVHVTGWTTDARRWLGAMDVFVMSSRYEGLPLALLEAMHAGLPVVAYDVGSVADAVQDGETGYVVPVDDKRVLADRLLELLASPAKRTSMGRRGRDVALREFSAATMARRYEDIYRALSARSSSRRTAFRTRRPPT
jgi:glycosyltransferase involved in cell wall biosynthesis